MGLGDSDTMDEQGRQALDAFKKFLQNSRLPRLPEYMIRYMAKYSGVEISRCRRAVPNRRGN
jgi:hypothetical protein